MSVHVAITRKVLPGKEAEFKEALRRFLSESFAHDGVHGASMITSLSNTNAREIGILRTNRKGMIFTIRNNFRNGKLMHLR